MVILVPTKAIQLNMHFTLVNSLDCSTATSERNNVTVMSYGLSPTRRLYHVSMAFVNQPYLSICTVCC